MAGREIELELLPWEREVLLKWNHTPEVETQLKECAARHEPCSIRIPRFVLGWLASDLNHAIVKRGCRDENVFELAERLDYAEQSGDGMLDGWY
jgi:hypothetical protein